MLAGEIPEFVVKEGEEVVLSCPVNTPGELGEWDNIALFHGLSSPQSAENITH